MSLIKSRLDWSVNADSLSRKGQAVLPEEARVLHCLQETTADVLSVCGSQYPLLLCVGKAVLREEMQGDLTGC